MTATVSIQRTLRVFRHGPNDRTTRLDVASFRRATLTPDGPGTLWLRWAHDPAPDQASTRLAAEAFGPGAGWLLDRVGRLIGAADEPVHYPDAPPQLQRALRDQRTFRVGASGLLYHELLPVIIAQRITAADAIKQWYRLVDTYGGEAPGPSGVVKGLRLPPTPDVLRRLAPWRLHPLGVEESRARALIELGRHPVKLFQWAELPSPDAQQRLQRLPGIGPWTAGSVAGPALGDPDAVPVGDFHFPNIVAWFLAGEPRGDDARMLELLAPYTGQRGRVLRAITGQTKAPSFGARKPRPHIERR